MEIKVTVRPPSSVADSGSFTPHTFTDLLQREIMQPGLDPSWLQILVNARILDGGDAAELTVHCEPRQAHLNAHQSLRVFPGTPPAYVRILTEDGVEVHAGKHASPFHLGQRVAVGEDLYEVIGEQWPGRHPETGVCAGTIDWQHVTVREVDAPSLFPAAV